MEVLIKASTAFGLHKLLSRVFPENEASLGLLESVGFHTVGVHENHGKLEGQWRDVVAVERLIPENP
jgi:phosphinothricin acetyltransferase